MNKLKQKKGQSYLAYAVLIAVVVAVFLGMKVFVGRALQEKFRQSADSIGQGEQYEPGVTRVGDSDSANPCPAAIAQVMDLDAKIQNLVATQNTTIRTITELQTALVDEEVGSPRSVFLEKQLIDTNRELQSLRQEEANRRNEIENIEQAFPQCF